MHEFKIKVIDIDSLTIAELEVLDKMTPFAEAIAILERHIEGGVRKLPAVSLPRVMKAVVAEFTHAVNEGEREGN